MSFLEDNNEEEEAGKPITEKALKELIKKHKLYSTPELNDVLYLHYQGFTKISNLEPYTGLKALWLNHNAISQIEGLDNLKELKCLYLGNNIIDEIKGIDQLTQLDTLSLSYNYVTKITGLSKCQNLKTLELDHNKLRNPDDLIGILEAPSLQILNISENNIADEKFAEILSGLKNLKVLRANGNPVCREMKNYRRRIILMFPELTYLDDAPISEEDRRLALAWQKGGKEAENAERIQIKKEKDAAHMKSMKEFRSMQRKALLDAGLSLDDHPDLKSDDENETISEQKEESEEKNDEIFFVTEGADIEKDENALEKEQNQIEGNAENHTNFEGNIHITADPNDEID